MISQIYGVQIKTKNVDKLKKFYAEKLGLAVSHTCSGCAVLDAGKEQFLGIQRHAEVAADAEGKTPVTFALRVADLAAAHKTLSKAGVEFISAVEDEPWARVATLLDPDGNRVVLVQDKGAKKDLRCSARNLEELRGGVPGPEPAPKDKGGKKKA